MRHAVRMPRSFPSALGQLQIELRKARFLARFLLQVGGRGLRALRRRAPPAVAAVAYDDILEILQSRDAAVLAGLAPDLARGADPYGQPWLFHAIDFGSVAALRALLAQGAGLGEDRHGRSALQAAIERSVTEDEFDEAPEDPLPMIALLVAAGAGVNAADSKGLRPLHIAASLGAQAAAQALRDLGADPALPDGMGRSAAAYQRLEQ